MRPNTYPIGPLGRRPVLALVFMTLLWAAPGCGPKDGEDEPKGEKCQPSCVERGCGDDGCGGSCGTCSLGHSCEEGKCALIPPPCLEIRPGSIDFGRSMYGRQALLPLEIESCDTGPQEIPSLSLSEDSSPSFTAGLGDPSSGSPGAGPHMLSAGDGVDAFVAYEPMGEHGSADEGTLIVVAAHPDERGTEPVEKRIPLRGETLMPDEPVATIRVKAGCRECDEIPVGTVLHLDGSKSAPGKGATVESYSWSADPPEGSRCSFEPDPASPSPTFELSFPGDYGIHLQIENSAGEVSEPPASMSFESVIVHDLYIELQWHTPNDPDEHDTGEDAGSDVDLHFADDRGDSGHDRDGDGVNEPWFDSEHDVYWFHPTQSFGNTDPRAEANPVLLRDDADGAGPESIGFNFPAEEAAYHIGVHYRSDHEYGPSFVNVRVFKEGKKIFERSDVKLVSKDFWWVATVSGSPPTVVPKTTEDGSRWITGAYLPSDFVFP